jgi:Asp-tRNA(Asn)/Glu-tRNA(Gln) amidotransferase A subunit family amidase
VQEVLKGSVGLPVGVQFVSTPYNEEKILYLMETVEKEIQFRKSYQPPI